MNWVDINYIILSNNYITKESFIKKLVFFQKEIKTNSTYSEHPDWLVSHCKKPPMCHKSASLYPSMELALNILQCIP